MVKDLLPKSEEIPGWKVEYLPIADTPEMMAKVNEALNYDDASYAIYTRGTQRISFYIAYWAPGKMAHRLVATHTPDVCWVAAGWKKKEARSGVLFSVAGGDRLPSAEERLMTLGEREEHVVFWHFLDGQSMSYGTTGLPPWHATITDLFSKKLKQRPEQWFVRISGNQPVSTWQDLLVMTLLWDNLGSAVQAGARP